LPTILRVGAANAWTESCAYHLELGDADIRHAADGWHAVLRLGGATHRLWLPQIPTKSLIIELPLDPDFDIRAQAARRLWLAIGQRTLGPPPVRLSVQRRQRLALTLRALDGHTGGNSYRAIAAVLFGKHGVTDRSWKTHDLRSRTIRLVQNGLSLVRGGYRTLLRVRSGKR
jgi:hypothetical protein